MKINDKEGQWSIDSIISIYRIIFFRIKRSLSEQPTTKGWMTMERQPIQIKSSTLRLKLRKESPERNTNVGFFGYSIRSTNPR